ncbi:MAG TPA: gamma-glutamyltransferase family protein [Acidimicrobiia bacterium]
MSPRAARRFPRGVVATPHHLASATGVAVLAQGGNAMDAVIAANLTLGVVAPYACGYGGDLFAIVWDGALTGYLGSGRSAGGATLDSMTGRSDGPWMPVLGPDSVTVPGAIAGWFDLLARWGTRDVASLVGDAVSYARDGFAVSDDAARMFHDGRRMYPAANPWYGAWHAVYGDVGGGTWLRQPALARTIETLAADGPDAYYRGPIGEAIVETLGAHGGAMAAADLTAHVGEWVDPLHGAYRDVDVVELPPPTQGVTALEALRLLDGLPLPPDGPARQHLLIEALKLALVDRDEWVSDPAAMPHPASHLLATPYLAARRATLRADAAGTPAAGVPQPGGTAYLCAADGDGLLVSLIQSNFLHFGAGVHVPKWGVNLNNRGSSFSLDGGRVNAFAPAKRPLHTLIPAMALRDGVPHLVFGSMGGDAQPGVHVQLLAHLIDDGADPAAAVAAPRWRVDPGSWRVRAESRFGPAFADALRAFGHEVVDAPPYDANMGHAHVIRVEAGGGYAAVADTRSEGLALGH